MICVVEIARQSEAACRLLRNMERSLREAEERQAAALVKFRLKLLEDLQQSLSRREPTAAAPELWQPDSAQLALPGPLLSGGGLIEAAEPQPG